MFMKCGGIFDENGIWVERKMAALGKDSRSFRFSDNYLKD